jgi:DegV family protein with EDD domain
MLANGSDVATSQPAPLELTNLWDELLGEYDEIVHIPMSSALSSSCATAKALAADYDGKVWVVDNKRISISERQSAIDALHMAEQGMGGEAICRKLEESAYDCSIYLAVNTLELLKKSGRVTSAGAAIATVLGIKPVLQIQGEKLDAFAKARGMAKAKTIMLEAAKKDLNERFAGKKVRIDVAYSGDEEEAGLWLNQVQEYFGDTDIRMYRLPISICCHVGAGVAAVGCITEL